MKKLLYKINLPLMYIGVGIIIFCVFVIGDNDGDGRIEAISLMYIGGACCAVAGVMIIYRRVVGEDKDI